jgi:hypothetical protein
MHYSSISQEEGTTWHMDYSYFDLGSGLVHLPYVY